MRINSWDGKGWEEMFIPERFKKQINTHLLGNMLDIDDYPLILAIMGRPGMGKTRQLRIHLEQLGVDIFSISSAELECEGEDAAAKLLRQQYINASVNILKKKPSVLVIDDIDTVLGESNTGAARHQGVLAFLMHISDDPYYIENVGNVNRVPVFFTGNNFESLYEPMRRPGRTLEFEWEPKQEEKIDIIASCLSNTEDSKQVAAELVDIYPNQSISFFTNFFTAQKLELLSEMASNAMLKCILENSQYKRQLYQKYIQDYNDINWKDVMFMNRENKGL